MAGKVIDFSEARERLTNRPSDTDFSVEKEMEWANAELDAADLELDKITEELDNLTQYMIELTSYLSGISVAQTIKDDGYDEFIATIEAQRKHREYEESGEAPIQLELEMGEGEEALLVDFTPDFEIDDYN